MKTKLKKIRIFFAIIAGMLMFISCEKDVIYTGGTEIRTIWFDVVNSEDTKIANRWVWNTYTERFECELELPQMNRDMYDKGMINVSVPTMEYTELDEDYDGFESMKSLPYTRNYNSKTNGITFQETIGFEVTYNPGTICFFIHSDNPEEVAAKLGNHRFKVTLLWDPKQLPKVE